MNFAKDWKPIRFLEYQDEEPLPLAEVIPFIFKDQIKNARASDLDGEKIMILYDLSSKFHEYLCDEVGLIYGIAKKDMVTICVIINKDNNYLKYCKIVEPITSFLDLPSDILGLISQYLKFNEQLNLRRSCETIKQNIVYCNYENINFLFKLGKLIEGCSLILHKRNPEKYTIKRTCALHDEAETCDSDCYGKKFIYNNGVYSKLTVTEYPFKNDYKFTSYSNFKILGVDYTFSQLLDNIELIKSLKILVDLLDFDERLRNISKSFTQKDKTLMKQHKLSNHYYKTVDCYFKFNKDLKKFFNFSEWFSIVNDIICGDQILQYSLDELEDNIRQILDFGREVEINYQEIKTDLSICKKRYHDKKKHPYNYNSSSSDDY